MANKTKVVQAAEQVQTEQAKTEQAPRDIELRGSVRRVAFSIVDKLEENAKAGFCVEEFTSPELAQPLYRLCHEVLKGDIESLPVPITPFVSASQLVDLVSGAMILQPMLVKVIKEFQKNVEIPEPEPGAQK